MLAESSLLMVITWASNKSKNPVFTVCNGGWNNSVYGLFCLIMYLATQTQPEHRERLDADLTEMQERLWLSRWSSPSLALSI